MPTWDDVVAIASKLPEVTPSTSFGNPSLRVKDKFLCRMRTNPDGFVVRCIDIEDRDALLKGQPDVFYITPHYKNYPYIVVRLDAISDEQLAEMVEDAWRTQAPKRVVAAFDAAG